MDNFINQLLQEAGVPDTIDPETRAQLTKDLTDRVADLINQRLVDAMSIETATEFEKLIDANPEDSLGMQTFIAENLPDKEKIVAAALIEFRALYLGDKA